MADAIPAPIQNQISEILQAMRDAAPKVAEALVQLTFAQGILHLVLAAIGLIGFVISVTLMVTNKKRMFDNYGNGDAGFFQGLAGFFGSLVSLIIFFANIGDGIIYTVAPTGQTIMNIITAVKGG